MSWNYIQPVRIRFGNGSRNSLPDEITAISGSNGLLITSPSFEKRGIIDEIVQLSNGSIRHIYSHVSPNPDVTQCDECARILRDNHCDFVVALGGGSVLDCAKAAASFCTADTPAEQYLCSGLPIPKTHLPLIALPTTSGTGSEVTCVSVLSDHRRGIKAPLSSDSFYPAVAIIDPELTLSVPPHITASTGFDVLCHAIEAYWSIHHQPICDALAIKAARLVLSNILTAYNHPDDISARENMAEASVIAGLAFTMPKTTSAHACSYPLTNLLGIPHGEACALTITKFLLFNHAHGCGRIPTLANELGYSDPHQLADTIERLKLATGMRRDLKDFNLSADRIDALVKGSMHPNLKNNPIEVTEEDLRAIYDSLNCGS